jgi:metallo-beta-lactamase family protein
MIRIGFHGGAGTVTGSKHLLEVGDKRLLVDCGMFQGLKELRLRNWSPPEFRPESVSWVILTHAHIDHSGYLPRLCREGFDGTVLCTPPTRDLAEILLHDSAHLQEEDAEYLNEKGLTKHAPAQPLYGRADVERTLQRIQTRPYGAWFDVSPELRIRFRDAGHLLGSAIVDVVARDAGRELHVLFSGDVGRYDMPLVPDPEAPGDPDVLVVESTYGDRLHPKEEPVAALHSVLMRMIERRAVLLVPAFAVGRAQQLIYLAQQLVRGGRLPRFPIYLDSPMAIDATAIYARYPDLHGVPPDELADERRALSGPDVHLCRTVADSKKLNSLQGPVMILSSSGMLAGGRVLHHLRRILPDPRQMIALVGFQAVGTRGRMLQEGAKTIPIHREQVPVRSEVVDLGHLSGHADRDELLRWLKDVERPPEHVFVTHGEPQAASALVEALDKARGWKAAAPQLGQRFEL